MSLQQKCPIIHFKDLGDERGKLVVIEGGEAIPFEIKRVFYIYESDATVVRGQHANRESKFVLVNVAGKSKVRITDGKEEPDPLNQRYGQSYEQNDYSEPYPGFNDGYDAFGRPDVDTDSSFCPYCGTPVEEDFEYCHKCGQKLP